MSVSVLEQKSILIAEEVFRYQTPDGPVLSGVLSRASESHEIVVICHGLMGNKNTSDRVKLAYELAAQGFNSFRFDFRSFGESGGLDREMTLCGERSDLETTLALLSSLGYDTVHLIGGSMGGAVISTMDYTRLPMVQSLILWFPVMDFGRMSADFFSPAHREEAMRTGAAEIHSLRNGTVYHLGRDLFEEVSGRQPEEYLQSVQLPKLFVHGTGDTIVPWEQSRDASAHCPNSELVLIKDGTHSFSGSQRELNEAIDATLQFLSRVRART